MCTSNVTAGCPTLVREAFTADIPGSFASRGLHVESCSLLPNYTVILREPRDERYRETGNIQSDRAYTLFTLYSTKYVATLVAARKFPLLLLFSLRTKEIFSYISLRNNSIAITTSLDTIYLLSFNNQLQLKIFCPIENVLFCFLFCRSV